MPLQAGQAYIELVPRLDPGFAAKAGAAVEAATAPVMDRVTAKLSGVGERLRGFGTKLSTFVTLPLVGAGVVAFNFASDLNESLSKARVVFGPLSADIEAFALNAARNLGISRQEALEATGTFGNLFTAMGLAAPKSAELSKGIVTLSSDLASFNNANPADVLEALRAGLVGETEPLRRFGINLTAARVEEEALRLGLGKQGEELSAAAKAQAAYSLIMADTKTAQGDFARTADGAANKQRILTARLKDSAATIGTQLLPIGQRLLDFVGGLLDRFTSLSPGVQRLILIFAGLAAAAGPLAYVLGAISTVLGFLLSPIGLIVAAVALVAAGFYLAYTRIEPFREAVDAVVDTIVELAGAIVDFVTGDELAGWAETALGFFEEIGGAIADNLIGPVEEVGGAFADTFGGIAENVSRFVDRIAERLQPLKEAFANVFGIIAGIIRFYVGIWLGIWRAVGDDLVRWIKAAFDAVKSVIRGALDIIIGIIDVFVGIFTLDFGRAWEGLKGIVSGVFRAIAAIVTLGWETIMSIFGGFFSLIGSAFSAAWDFLKGIVSGAFGAIVGFVVGFASNFLGFWLGLWSSMIGFARDAIEGVVGFVAGLPGRILGFAGAVLNAAIGIGKAIIDGVGQGLAAVGGFVSDLASAVGTALTKAGNWLIDKINDAIPNKLGWGWLSVDIPDNPIPRFAGGGVTPGPPSRAMLAVLHGEEAVFNRDQLRALGRVIAAAPGARGGGAPLIGTYAPTFVLPDGSRRTMREAEAASLRGTQAALRAL